MYELVTAGFPVFAIICLLPVVFIAVIACFRSGILLFWFLIVINYLIMWKEIPLGSIPTSLPNEMIEIFLLALAIINVQESKFQRTGNLMLITLLVWCSFCILEVLNDTCGLPVRLLFKYFMLSWCFRCTSPRLTDSSNIYSYGDAWHSSLFFGYGSNRTLEWVLQKMHGYNHEDDQPIYFKAAHWYAISLSIPTPPIMA